MEYGHQSTSCDAFTRTRAGRHETEEKQYRVLVLKANGERAKRGSSGRKGNREIEQKARAREGMQDRWVRQTGSRVLTEKQTRRERTDRGTQTEYDQWWRVLSVCDDGDVNKDAFIVDKDEQA